MRNLITKITADITATARHIIDNGGDVADCTISAMFGSAFILVAVITIAIRVMW